MRTVCQMREISIPLSALGTPGRSSAMREECDGAAARFRQAQEVGACEKVPSSPVFTWKRCCFK